MYLQNYSLEYNVFIVHFNNPTRLYFKKIAIIYIPINYMTVPVSSYFCQHLMLLFIKIFKVKKQTSQHFHLHFPTCCVMFYLQLPLHILHLFFIASYNNYLCIWPWSWIFFSSNLLLLFYSIYTFELDLPLPISVEVWLLQVCRKVTKFYVLILYHANLLITGTSYCYFSINFLVFSR